MMRKVDTAKKNGEDSPDTKDFRFDAFPIPIKADPKRLSSSVVADTSRSSNKSVMKRRNSTGTIYVGTTMSRQDDNATIECVCTVIRAHMIEAAMNSCSRRMSISPEYDVFIDSVLKKNDGYSVGYDLSSTDDGIYDEKNESKIPTPEEFMSQVPTIETVIDFFVTVKSENFVKYF